MQVYGKKSKDPTYTHMDNNKKMVPFVSYETFKKRKSSLIYSLHGFPSSNISHSIPDKYFWHQPSWILSYKGHHILYLGREVCKLDGTLENLENSWLSSYKDKCFLFNRGKYGMGYPLAYA